MAKASELLSKQIQMDLGKLPEAVREEAQGWLRDLLERVTAYDTADVAATSNADLSTLGRYNKRAANNEAGQAKVAAFDSAFQRVRDRKAGLEQKLLRQAVPTPPAEPGARLAWELNKAEIRSALAPLSPAERADVLQNSADPLVVDAILSAPPTFSKTRRFEPFIDPEARAKAVLDKAKVADKATTHEFEDLSDLVRTVEHAIGLAKGEIAREMPAAPLEAPAQARREDFRDPTTGKPMPAVR